MAERSIAQRPDFHLKVVPHLVNPAHNVHSEGRVILCRSNRCSALSKRGSLVHNPSQTVCFLSTSWLGQLVLPSASRSYTKQPRTRKPFASRSVSNLAARINCAQGDPFTESPSWEGKKWFVVNVLFASEEAFKAAKKEDADLGSKHGAYLRSLANSGVALALGPSAPYASVGKWGGIWLIRAADLSEATSIAHKAPYFKAGAIPDTKIHEWECPRVDIDLASSIGATNGSGSTSKLAGASGRGPKWEGKLLFVANVLYSSEEAFRQVRADDPGLATRHGAYIRPLADSGVLVALGPFTPYAGCGEWGGVWIIRAANLDEAMSILHNSPYFRAGAIPKTIVHEWSAWGPLIDRAADI
jgi:uncharacterized protein YciI